MGSPCGPLTRSYLCCCLPIFVFPTPFGVGLDGGQDAMTHRRRGFVQPVLPDTPVIFSTVKTCETQRVSRGKHRLLSAHDRQIYGARHRRIEDFILCCGLVPTIPRLKSACPLPFQVRGIPVRRPTLLPPASFRRTLLQHPCLRLSFPSVRVDLDFAWHLCHSARHHHLAAGPCPAHIGIGRSLTTPPSHTTQHTGPYDAVRLIRQVQLQGNESPSDVKCLSGKAILTHFTLLILQGPLRAQPVVTA